MTSGTTNKHTLTKIYNPKLNVSEVTLELYYEKELVLLLLTIYQ